MRSGIVPLRREVRRERIAQELSNMMIHDGEAALLMPGTTAHILTVHEDLHLWQ